MAVDEDAGQIDLEPEAGERQDADLADIERPAEDEAQPPAAVRLVTGDALFDEAFYCREAGITGSRIDLVTHYLTTGEAAGLSPSPEFDACFYRDTNSDVVRSGGGLLLHYLQHGRRESRYANRQRLRRDVGRIEASGLFDARAYAWDRGRVAMPGMSDIEDYLIRHDDQSPIGTMFDSDFYAHAYDDVSGTEAIAHGMPILHYINVGRAQHRVCNAYQLNEYLQLARPRFNEPYYLDQLRSRFPNQPPPFEPLRHYILTGSRLGLDPAPDFSADYYLRLYPDMRQSGMSPFYHFVAHGHREGRTGRPDFSSIITQGEVVFDTRRPTILVASHEASRTGAPLVGLNVGARLADTHNVISYLGRAGSLLGDFAKHSCTLVVAPMSPLDAEYLLLQLKRTHRLAAVLLNSSETSPFAHAALQADLPSVALVHEFAEYTLPSGRMSDVIESTNRIIAPATLIHDSLQAELLATRAGPANNIEVRPQGYLPRLPDDGADDDLTRDEILAMIGVGRRKEVKLVLGAGYVQMRKGVDLFVQTAAEMRRLFGGDFRFIWVGDGYLPKSDLHYSAWVADMIRRLDLEQHVFFLPVQSSLNALFARLSDVFYLPSRLDPFPNVALDAFRAGRAVVCFDRATGIAETLRDAPGQQAAVGAAVAYCNVTQAAEALIRLFKPAEAKRALGNAALAQRQFDFGAYMEAIAAQLASAAVLQEEAAHAAHAIAASGLFDASFHENIPAPVDPSMQHAAIKAYVARGQKGLLRYNPRPGVNEGVARQRLLQPGPALDRHGGPPTHRCVILPRDLSVNEPVDAPNLRAALHLHLHYPELAAEFAARLAQVRMRADFAIDLIVTTTSDARRLEIEYALRGYKGGSMRYLVVPNRGRDIGPFLTEAGRIVTAGAYDVVGHLHGKRSLAVDAALGDRWRSYLLDSLLDGHAAVPAALALFKQDAALGLVFAEDRHCVGWSKNRDIAIALAARMEPSPALPEWPIFPIGTMFWARPAALAPLWALGLGLQDFPAEPAPYDGTVLHALERMLPAVCEATGHGWCTVYREGSGW